MLRVGMHEARPGMELALPIFHPRRPGTILLKPGIELDDRSIDRLRELELKEVWIRFPGTQFVAQYINPEVFAAQQRLASGITTVFEAVSADAAGSLDYAGFRRSIAGMLDKLLANPAAAIFVQEIGDDRPLMRHSGTVCFLSLLMGLRLDGYMICERSRLTPGHARDVSNLGVGAMVHDIGMLRLDPATLDRWNATHDESDPAFREHVHIGFDMVKGAIGPSAAAAVLHHHQRYDGSGFPNRPHDGREEPLSGSDIHIFARIIAAADLFDRRRNPPGAAGPVPLVRALRSMIEPPIAPFLDPFVVRALLSVVPPYAPGSLVTLSDSRRAAVVGWTILDPCRPTVQIVDILNPEIRDHEGERIDLRAEPAITIKEMDGQDVSAANFYPAREGDFDINLAERALINAAARADRPKMEKSEATWPDAA